MGTVRMFLTVKYVCIPVCIPGYQLFCNDNMHHRHGNGVLLYIKTIFTVTVLPSRHGNKCWSTYFVLVISSHVLHLLPWLVWFTCSYILESGYTVAIYCFIAQIFN